MEKSNLRLGQWTVKNTNVWREKVSSNILLDGCLSALVKENYKKITEKKEKKKDQLMISDEAWLYVPP